MKNEKDAMYWEMMRNQEMAKTMKLARRWPFILLGIVGLFVLGMFIYIRFFLFS